MTPTNDPIPRFDSTSNSSLRRTGKAEGSPPEDGGNSISASDPSQSVSLTRSRVSAPRSRRGIRSYESMKSVLDPAGKPANAHAAHASASQGTIRSSTYVKGVHSTLATLSYGRTAGTVVSAATGAGKSYETGATASQCAIVSAAASIAEMVNAVMEWRGVRAELKSAVESLHAAQQGHDRFLLDPQGASPEDAADFLTWRRATESAPALADKLASKRLALIRHTGVQILGNAANVARHITHQIPAVAQAGSAVAQAATITGVVGPAFGVIAAPFEVAHGARDLPIHRKEKDAVITRLIAADHLALTDRVSTSRIYCAVSSLHRERLAYAHRDKVGAVFHDISRTAYGVMSFTAASASVGVGIAVLVGAGVASAGVVPAVVGGVAGATYATVAVQRTHAGQQEKAERRKREAAANALIASVPAQTLRDMFQSGAAARVQVRFLVKYNPHFPSHRKLGEDQTQYIGHKKYLKAERTEFVELKCNENEYLALHMLVTDLDPLGGPGTGRAPGILEAARYLHGSGRDPLELMAIVQVAGQIPLLSQRLHFIKTMIAPQLEIPLSGVHAVTLDGPPAVSGDHRHRVLRRGEGVSSRSTASQRSGHTARIAPSTLAGAAPRVTTTTTNTTTMTTTTTTTTAPNAVAVHTSPTAQPHGPQDQLSFTQLRGRICSCIDALAPHLDFSAMKFERAPQTLTMAERELVTTLLVAYNGKPSQYRKQLEADVARLHGYRRSARVPLDLAVQERIALILGHVDPH